MIFEKLQEFRKAVYESLGPAKDAVFELMDAVLTTPSVSSFVSLSLSPVFRRQWPSVYTAVQASRVPRAKLMRQYIAVMPVESQPLLAGDHTAWARPDAITLKDRTFEHDTTSGKPPISVGQGYSTLTWVPETSGSWALPLRHERISSFETPSTKAAFQLKQVTRQLSVRPLAVYDREYGTASFVNQTRQIPADLLLRVASNRCLWGAPPPYGGRGAPRKHGDKFKLNAPTSWATPVEVLEVHDPQLGQVRLLRWSHLHFQKAPQRQMELLRVEVVHPVGRKRKFQPLWLAWLGETMPALSQLWLKYLRRFACDHWYRFAKQRLHWTLPQLTQVSATERWSDLMPLMTWQLWLARDELQDHPLPWQSPQETLSPGRVAQGFAVILAAIGTPAKAPKPRGKSPGWPKGKPRPPRPHYPTVKKRASRKRKSENSPNSSLAGAT
jgi:hypothetical protein